MLSVHLVLLILFAVFEALATFGAAVPRINLVAAGLFCFALAQFI